MDFVIPLKCRNLIIRSVVECIVQSYKPRNIYIITPHAYISTLKNDAQNWKLKKTNILYYDEETFFLNRYGLTKNDIENMYYYKDENDREFGWWFQQLIKLGALSQIHQLSDPFMVWDSDLIALKKWEIYPTKYSQSYKFAILQEKAKSEWNKEQYQLSIKSLLGFDAIEPDEGTFVPHHFIMHHQVINNMLKYIEKRFYLSNKLSLNWIEIIMKSSMIFYRFSEYKCTATFMNMFHKDLLNYHPFYRYGNGLRFREPEEILKDICSKSGDFGSSGLSFKNVKSYASKYLKNTSYLQLEHVLPF
jgi:hypothetical protein